MCFDYNNLKPSDPKRRDILKELISDYSEYVFIESDFKCVYGKNIHFKGMALLNFNCTLLDTRPLTIGHRALIGPNCNIICTNHSIDVAERLQGVFDNKPITIGDNVWIGANVTICPGVTIGDGSVIGAGSLVTKDIPENVVAVGSPCKVLRPITEEDKINKM